VEWHLGAGAGAETFSRAPPSGIENVTKNPCVSYLFEVQFKNNNFVF
jgi:hypothetical protein